MRYVTLSQAMDACMPLNAVMLYDSSLLKVFTSKGEFYVIRFIELPSSCEDCTTMWIFQVDFKMSLDNIIKVAHAGKTLDDLVVGDKVNYTPRICVLEHKALVGVEIREIVCAGDMFNQTMIATHDDEGNGWMPLRECEVYHD